MLALICSNAFGQIPAKEYAEPAKLRLLVRITAQYIHTISQGQIDMDSAVRIPCKVYGLSPLLPYDEGYNAGREYRENQPLTAGKVAATRTLLTKLHGKYRIRLLLDLGSYFIFKPGTAKADLDQAAAFIDEAVALSPAGTWKIESLLLKAHWLHQSGKVHESQKLFTGIETLCVRSGDTLAYARALLHGGEVLPYGDPKRVVKFEKAISIFRAKNLKEKEIEALSLINIENFVARRYDEAEVFLRQIVKLQAAIHFHHQQYPFDALSWLSYRKGALTNALFYSNKSLACLSSRADSAFAAFFYTRRGLVYERLFNYKEAMIWFDKALSRRTRETRVFWYRSVIGKVGMLNKTGKAKDALQLLQSTSREYPPASYFEKMHFALLLGMTQENVKNFAQAEVEYETFLALAEQFPAEHVYDEFPAAFFMISRFYRIIGKTEKARKLLTKGNDFASTFDIYAKENYYYNLYKIDSMEGKYLEAIKNQSLSYESMDSVFGYDQRKRAEELLVKYELEKKDKSIKLLNSKNQLQRIQTEQAHRARNITIAGLLVALVIIMLLLNRYKIKQKANHALELNKQELDQTNSFLKTLNADQDKLLREKEWLITELHHRVKNNLHMITSLLHSQSAYLKDDGARLALKDSLRRMHSMSLIHQKLYREESSSTIPMDEYINDLVRYLYESFEDKRQITFRQETEPIHLHVSQAIPLGLILTEGIVNAVKYAFPHGRNGIISIQLHHFATDYLMLQISDDGIGFPVEKDEYHSLGLNLMKGLSSELNGEFSIQSINGVHIEVTFPVLTNE
ncbi:hypothetical protein GCM10010967_56120 [Dyadobacter beijingensis]|uniref:histidine kinase n=1 Tax=Dyadobacter beijingensis TaxID=365489 RepID=A0ABQ2IJX3_9BACT|nr:sensor histidine kinase [Dyadobacter beijingensis]GGN12867.1 hypothetical protein GCM10010967_56120 [Dyadobacter beijingensis]